LHTEYVTNTEGKIPRGRFRRKWVDIIKIGSKKYRVWESGLDSSGSGLVSLVGFCESGYVENFL